MPAQDQDGERGGAWRAPEFWLLFTAAVCGAFGLSWWIVIPLTVAGLSISSLPKYIELWPRAQAAGATHQWLATVGLSMLNSLGAALAAFAVGCAVGWFWGVTIV